jgi:hypothetical protein
VKLLEISKTRREQIVLARSLTKGMNGNIASPATENFSWRKGLMHVEDMGRSIAI